MTAKIVGQKKALDALHSDIKKYLNKETTGSSYLFEGPISVGKFKTAVQVSRWLVCSDNGCTENNLCASCLKVNRDTHPDVKIVKPEKYNISIEVIREALQHFHFHPLEGRARILIIDQAECLNIFAANALLKTLEEPPKQGFIFLVTSSPSSLPATVRSRCRRMRFQPLCDDVRASLYRTTVTEAALYRLAKDHLKSSDSNDPSTYKELTNKRNRLILRLEEIYAPESGTAKAAIWQLMSGLLANDDSLSLDLALLSSLFRDAYYLQHNISEDHLANRDKVSTLKRLGNALTPEKCLEILRVTENTLRSINVQHANKKLAIENIATFVENSL